MQRTLNLLGISVLALLAVGFVVLASACEANGIRLYNNAYHFVIHQAIWLFAVAVPALLVATFVDYHIWRRNAWLSVALYVGVCVLLCAALGFRAINGSHRWIILGPIRLQPSELAKIAVIIAVGVFLDRIGWRIELFKKGAMPAVCIIGVLTALTVAEPDYGSTMVIALTGFALLLVGGMKIVHFGLLGGIGAVGVLGILARNANRMRRIVAWLPNELAMKVSDFLSLPSVAVEDPKVEAARYQLEMALAAIRRGGLTGVGFNKSIMKQRYLPEAHTDFIFPIGAEEWGLAFSLLLLALFVTLFACGMHIALRAPDRLGRYLAFGATFLIFFQALFNIGVVTGCLPTKGLALPFISYGGTNLVTALVAVGLLFNVGRQVDSYSSRPRMRRQMPSL